MYNQTQLIMISRRLFPNKNVFNLNKQEQSKVIEEYERTNQSILQQVTEQICNKR